MKVVAIACMALVAVLAVFGTARAGPTDADRVNAVVAATMEQLNAMSVAASGETLQGVLNMARSGRLAEIVGSRATTQACSSLEDETCVRSCAAPLTKFRNNDCLGTDDDVLSDIFGSGDGDDSSDSFFGGVLLDLDNVTSASAAQFDRFCECGSTISSFFRALFSVLRCVAGSDAFDDSPFNPDDFGNMLSAMIKFICVNNGEEYCYIAFRDQDLINVDSDTAYEDADEDVKCEFFELTGCCIPSFVAAFRDPALAALFDEADEESEGSNDDDPREIIEQMETDLATCGYGDVEPCLGPGESATYAVATTRIEANFAVIATNAAKRDAFKRAFRRDVAAGLGLLPPQVEITSLTEGSVVVGFRIRGSDKKAALDAAVASGIPLTNVRSDVAEFSSVADINSTGTTTEEATVENEADPSSAHAAVPSLLLAALVALFVMLL